MKQTMRTVEGQDYVTLAEAAARLGVSIHQVRSHAGRGSLPVWKLPVSEVRWVLVSDLEKISNPRRIVTKHASNTN